MSVEESLLMIRQKIINKCGAQADNMHRAFRVFDKDGSGEIGVEEFQEVMQKEMMLIFDDKLANEIIDTLDTDHSVRKQPSDIIASSLSPPFMNGRHAGGAELVAGCRDRSGSRSSANTSWGARTRMPMRCR